MTLIPVLMMSTMTAILSIATVAVAALEFGPYRVTVEADTSDAMLTSDYQVIVANEELVLTRLTATYRGTLSQHFVADLDGDGRFEVVVVFSYDQGRATGLHLYSWNGYLLEPLVVAPLDAADAVGYRGGDEFAVVNGALVRLFQVHEERDDVWQATAVQRRLRYSLVDSRWIREQ